MMDSDYFALSLGEALFIFLSAFLIHPAFRILSSEYCSFGNVLTETDN